MDYKFLDKVLDQIVSEITIDYEKEKIYVPFLYAPLRLHPSTMTGLRQGYTSPFSEHCRDVYGLNKDETDYVWDQLRNKINNSIR